MRLPTRTASIILALATLALAGCTFSSEYVYVDVRLPGPSTPQEAQHNTATPASVPTMHATQEHAPTPTPTAAGKACVVTLSGGDYLRVRATPWGDHVRWLKNGVEVSVIGAEWDTSGDLWYKIAPQEWVYAGLVRC